MQIDDLPLTERNDLATTQADQSVSTVAATLKANNIGATHLFDDFSSTCKVNPAVYAKTTLNIPSKNARHFIPACIKD